MNPASPTAPFPSSSPTLSRRVRLAYVGMGGRVRTFLDPVASDYAKHTEIVGLCDLSRVRVRVHQKRLCEKFGYDEVPVFSHAEFTSMLRETRPDTVFVCTIDREHAHYIIEALQAGCDVITEKPMAIDRDQCRAISEAVTASGRKLRVAFNYRWGPGPSKVREVLASGVIGSIRQVTMEYLLNTSHGADYFRRWHANKQNSGGLLVHKSTHHFDLINWWTNAIPEEVHANGALSFYGRDNAIQRGDEALTGYPRYHDSGCATDPFAYSYDKSMLQDGDLERALYLGEAERETGYVRDRNVFRDDITIEDTMNVLVRYRTGMLLNYSLNAYSPYEGYRVAFAGDRGRVEYEEMHGAHIPFEETKVNEHFHSGGSKLRVYPHFKMPYDVEIPKASGAHGGGDLLLQQDLFDPTDEPDPLGRSAGHEQGVASVMVGVAANISLTTGLPTSISQLLPLKPHALHLSELH